MLKQESAVVVAVFSWRVSLFSAALIVSGAGL